MFEPHHDGDFLLRTIIEGRMDGKKTRGRPRMMPFDWMMKESLQQVEGESRTTWGMAAFDVRTCLKRQRTKRRRSRCQSSKFMV